MYWLISSAKLCTLILKHKAIATEIIKEIVNIFSAFPCCPFAFSCAVSFDIVVERPEEEIAHINKYKGVMI